MKKILYALLFSSFLGGQVKAQKSWEYNFGDSKGTINIARNTSVIVSSTTPFKLLPAPAESQIVKLRVGNNKGNNGGFELINQKGKFGSGARLVITSPNGGSTNKFSIIGIDGTALFSIGFNIEFQSGNKGSYKFAIGKDPALLNTSGSGHTPFSNNYNFSPSAVLPAFLILQWDISASGYQLSVQQKEKNLQALDRTLNPSVSFVNGGEYQIHIYANNSENNESYRRNGNSYTVIAGASHIWVNNQLLLKSAANPNFITSELTQNEKLNAFMFLGLNTDNAKAYLDDFAYSNYISADSKNKLEKTVPKTNSQSIKNIDSVWGLGNIETRKKTDSIFAKTEAADPAKFKILSCNILKGFSGDAALEKYFQNWVAERKPDVVAFQEMNGFTQQKLQEFGAKIGYPYVELHKEEGYPLGLMSKYPINNVKKITEGMRHGILYGKILDYHFVVTHLNPYTYQLRIDELDNVLLKFINQLPKGEKIVMMGDFNNMSPQDKQYYDNNPSKIELLIKSEKNNPKNKILKDGKIEYTAIQKILDAGFFDTYKMFNKNYDKSAPTKVKNHNNYTRIDYIWVNKELKKDCEDMTIVKDDFTDYLSDHYPTLLVLKRDK